MLLLHGLAVTTACKNIIAAFQDQYSTGLGMRTKLCPYYTEKIYYNNMYIQRNNCGLLMYKLNQMLYSRANPQMEMICTKNYQ